jgi:ketosteroid isomerase-like protein
MANQPSETFNQACILLHREASHHSTEVCERGTRMIARSPEEAVELLDRAFNEADVEAILAFYEDAAVVVTEPGHLARGSAELRNFFERIVGSGSSVKQLKTFTLEADGIALFLSRWSIHRANEGAARTFVATTVLRKQPDGGWRALIDNAFGPSVLGE